MQIYNLNNRYRSLNVCTRRLRSIAIIIIVIIIFYSPFLINVYDMPRAPEHRELESES